jgi:hypothetical protein
MLDHGVSCSKARSVLHLRQAILSKDLKMDFEFCFCPLGCHLVVINPWEPELRGMSWP